MKKQIELPEQKILLSVRTVWSAVLGIATAIGVALAGWLDMKNEVVNASKDDYRLQVRMEKSDEIISKIVETQHQHQERMIRLEVQSAAFDENFNTVISLLKNK